MLEKSDDPQELPIGATGDRTLVHEAWLCVMSDPEFYSSWQYEFINNLKEESKDQAFSLSRNRRFYVQKILDK